MNRMRTIITSTLIYTLGLMAIYGAFSYNHPYLWILSLCLILWPLCLYLESSQIQEKYLERKEKEWANKIFVWYIFNPPLGIKILLQIRSLISLGIPIIYLWGILYLRGISIGKERNLWLGIKTVMEFLQSYPFIQPFLITLGYLIFLFHKDIRLWLYQEACSSYWGWMAYLYWKNPSWDGKWLEITSWVREKENKNFRGRIFLAHFLEKPKNLLLLGSSFMFVEFLLTRGSLCYSSSLTFLTLLLYFLFSLYSFLFSLEKDCLFSPQCFLLQEFGKFPKEDAKEWSQRFKDVERWDQIKIGKKVFFLPRYLEFYPLWVFWNEEGKRESKKRIFFKE